MSRAREMGRGAPFGAVLDAVDRCIPEALRRRGETRMRSRVLVVGSVGVGLLAAGSMGIRALTLPIDRTFWIGLGVIAVLLVLPVIQWVSRSTRVAGGLLSLALVITLPLIQLRIGAFPAPVVAFFPAVPLLVTFFVGEGLGLVATLALAGAALGLGVTLPTALGPGAQLYAPTLIATSTASPLVCYLLAAVYERNRRRNEADLEETNHALADARALAEEADRRKTEFLRHMSHELRTPLNAIVGYSELLAEVLEERADLELRGDADKIGAASRHLLGLINDLLDISKIEAGAIALHFEDFAIAPLVDELRGTLEPLAGGGGSRLQVEVEPDLPPIRCDRQRLQQILLNLAGNACKFTTAGVITIRCRRVGDHESARIAFEVEDTGEGIEPSRLADIFEPFVQVDEAAARRSQGTGLGLAITRKLVEHLGGTITVRSALGVGSTFAFDLPWRGPAAP